MALIIQARENRLRALRAIAAREENIFADPAYRASRMAPRPDFRSCRAQ